MYVDWGSSKFITETADLLPIKHVIPALTHLNFYHFEDMAEIPSILDTDLYKVLISNLWRHRT
jgi:hypothetical protein